MVPPGSRPGAVRAAPKCSRSSTADSAWSAASSLATSANSSRSASSSGARAWSAGLGTSGPARPGSAPRMSGRMNSARQAMSCGSPDLASSTRMVRHCGQGSPARTPSGTAAPCSHAWTARSARSGLTSTGPDSSRATAMSCGTSSAGVTRLPPIRTRSPATATSHARWSSSTSFALRSFPEGSPMPSARHASPATAGRSTRVVVSSRLVPAPPIHSARSRARRSGSVARAARARSSGGGKDIARTYLPASPHHLLLPASRPPWVPKTLSPMRPENNRGSGPVPCRNSFTASDLAFRARYAALRYSLISPPTTLLRSIRAVISTAWPGCLSGGSCCRPWCGRWPL